MKIGVIGGGQLGRMLALAGTPLGMNFAFLDPAPDACAASLGEHIRADYGDQEHLRQLAEMCIRDRRGPDAGLRGSTRGAYRRGAAGVAQGLAAGGPGWTRRRD